LQQHPVLVPLILLGGSLVFGLSVFLFPLLMGGLMENFAILCISIACVLGATGLLAGITGILELVDQQSQRTQYRTSLLAAMLSRLKE